MKRTKIQNETVFMLEDETYHGTIMPHIIKELNRDVKLFNDVHLHGGIFGHNVEIYAHDIYIRDAVFATNGILLTGEKPEGKTWIHSVLSAEESIVSDGNAQNRVRISNNVSARKIKLKNTIVYGNVFGTDVILEDSIVMGGIYCKNKLEVKNAIAGTFETKDFIVNGKFGLINNFATCTNKPELAHDLFSISLISFNGKPQNSIFPIAPEDVYPFFDQETGLRNYFISPTLRIFDVREFEKILQENNQKLVEITSIDKKEYKNCEEKFQEFEIPLFDIVGKEFNISAELPRSTFMSIPTEKLTEETDRLLPEQTENQPEDIAPETESTLTESSEENNENQEVDESVPEPKAEAPGFCTNCGQQITNPNTKFCTNCGNPLE